MKTGATSTGGSGLRSARPKGLHGRIMLRALSRRQLRLSCCPIGQKCGIATGLIVVRRRLENQ
jgi:hypothetical protein